MEPLRATVELVQAGGIVGIKGLGGFHLACDATNPEAINLLRERKRRDQKPFAVMVRDIAMANALAVRREAEQEEEALEA